MYSLKGRLDQYVQKKRGEKEDYPKDKQMKEEKHEKRRRHKQALD